MTENDGPASFALRARTTGATAVLAVAAGLAVVLGGCGGGTKGEAKDAGRTIGVATSGVTIVALAPTEPVPQLAAIAVTPQARVSETPEQGSTLILVTATPSLAASNTPAVSASNTQTSTSTPTPSPTSTPAGTPTATPTPTATLPPSQLSDVEKGLLDAHNEARRNQGLSSLRSEPALVLIARERARYMAQVNSMTHYGPNGGTVFTMMNAAGYAYTDGAENIHYNHGFSETQSWQTAMAEYLASASHRAAIMKPGFKKIGIGVATSASGVRYYSVVFSD